MATSYLVAIRWHSGRHEVIAECDDVRFPDFDRSKLRAPFRELPLAGGERDSCVLVVRDEVEPCIGAGLRTWFEGDAKEAQFFILRAGLEDNLSTACSSRRQIAEVDAYLMPAALMSLPFATISSATRLSNSAGVKGNGSTASCVSLARVIGDCSTFVVAV